MKIGLMRFCFSFLTLLAVIVLCEAQENVTWPYGTYGLVSASYGCPEGSWMAGSRTWDTEDKNANNEFSYDVYKIGGIFLANNIRLDFCMKVSAGNVTHVWPSGTYCILKLGDCPSGFQEGSLFWDDEDSNNHDDKTGVLPDGEYNHNTKMDFCCRSDGRPESEISLPSNRAFVLLRYGTICQHVANMYAEDSFIRWDDEDTANTDKASGHHPYDDGGADDHKLHFCYYSTPFGPGFG